MKYLRVAGIILSVFAIAMLTACEGDTGPAGATGATGPSYIVAYAHINAIGDADSPTGACLPDLDGIPIPCIFHFGGDDVTDITVEENATGDYTVRFYGSFGSFDDNPGEADRHEMAIFATVTDATNATEKYVISVENPGGLGREDQINVAVKIWESNLLTPADRNFTVMVVR